MPNVSRWSGSEPLLSRPQRSARHDDLRVLVAALDRVVEAPEPRKVAGVVLRAAVGQLDAGLLTAEPAAGAPHRGRAGGRRDSVLSPDLSSCEVRERLTG